MPFVEGHVCTTWIRFIQRIWNVQLVFKELWKLRHSLGGFRTTVLKNEAKKRRLNIPENLEKSAKNCQIYFEYRIFQGGHLRKGFFRWQFSVVNLLQPWGALNIFWRRKKPSENSLTWCSFMYFFLSLVVMLLFSSWNITIWGICVCCFPTHRGQSQKV